MRITVFGGTGPTGRELIRLGIAAGHTVTAVARDPAAVPDPPAGLTVRRGDVLDPASLAGTLDGADAVLSALGSRNARAPTTVYSAGVTNILDAMTAAGVHRLVTLSAQPVAPREQRSVAERWLIDPILYRLFGGGYTDMIRMEQVLAASTADWTVLRPPMLTDKPGTGRYRTAIDGPLPGAWSIPRADLAHAMLAALDNPSTVRAHVAVGSAW